MCEDDKKSSNSQTAHEEEYRVMSSPTPEILKSDFEAVQHGFIEKPRKEISSKELVFSGKEEMMPLTV